MYIRTPCPLWLNEIRLILTNILDSFVVSQPPVLRLDRKAKFNSVLGNGDTPSSLIPQRDAGVKAIENC